MSKKGRSVNLKGEEIDQSDSFESFEDEDEIENPNTGGSFMDKRRGPLEILKEAQNKKDINTLMDIKKIVEEKVKRIERNTRINKNFRYKDPKDDLRIYKTEHEIMKDEFKDFERRVKHNIRKVKTQKLRDLLEEQKTIAREMRPEGKKRVINHCKNMNFHLSKIEDDIEANEEVFEKYV